MACQVSIHHMLLFIKLHYNYLRSLYPFQYITCYSLSSSSGRVETEGTAFQYITCYSLSNSFDFHAGPPFRFNTSHVTLYRIGAASDLCASAVSIHHMLLFIGNQITPTGYISKFQYITCYSLSKFPPCRSCHTSRFNTSHVTLYHVQHLLLQTL